MTKIWIWIFFATGVREWLHSNPKNHLWKSACCRCTKSERHVCQVRAYPEQYNVQIVVFREVASASHECFTCF